MICVYVGLMFIKFQEEISKWDALLDFKCTDIIHSLY